MQQLLDAKVKEKNLRQNNLKRLLDAAWTTLLDKGVQLTLVDSIGLLRERIYRCYLCNLVCDRPGSSNVAVERVKMYFS